MCLVYDGNYGEQGAMIALSSHSDPPLIYFYLKRPVSSHSGNPLIYSDLRRPGSSHSGPLMDGNTSTRRGTEGETIIRHTVRQAVWHQKKPWEGSTLYHWPMVVLQEEDRCPCLAYLQHSYYGTTENTNS